MAQQSPEYNLWTRIDSDIVCPDYTTEFSTSELTQYHTRKVMPHTLHHGCSELSVADFTCTHCKRTIPYDGLSDGIFCLNKKHVFTRELLDMWLWDLCVTGSTFRDIYSSWETKTRAVSACFHCDGSSEILNMQKCNEAFTSFLKLLKFPSDDVLFGLFSCSVCERKDSMGNVYSDGIVMDGTTLGILGTCQTFNGTQN